MQNILLTINIIIPLLVIIVSVIRIDGVQFDHINLFSIGFIFYWICPVMLALEYIPVGKGILMYDDWVLYFNQLKNDKLNEYMICTILLYISYILGSIICHIINRNIYIHTNKYDKYIVLRNDNNQYIKYFLIILTIFAAFHIYPLIDKLFTGYTIAPMYKSTGPFTANIIIIMSIAILYYNKEMRKSYNINNYIKTINNPAFIIFLFLCILLSSLGTRSLLIASIIIYLSLYTCYYKKMNVLVTTIIFSIIVFVSHFILMFRIGSKFWHISNYNYTIISEFLFSDPLIISFSIWDYLHKYEISYIQYPISLISHVIGLIPSFIFPSKNNYYVEYLSLGYNFHFRQGTISTFVSLMINFGLIGSIIFMFILSYYLCWLKNQNKQPYITMYVMTCGWICISFFRIFETTVIKYILEFSIILPFMFAVSNNVINRFIKR